MVQLSLFSAGVAVPAVDDLGGLLAAGGQIARGDGGARLSVLVADEWRAVALVDEFARRGLRAQVASGEATMTPEPSDDREDTGGAAGTRLVRSDVCAELAPVAIAWTRGAVKTVPPLPAAPGGLLRCWALAAGRPDSRGFLLGADRHASHLYPRLAAALAGVGLTCSVVGSRGGGPGMRIVGRRRLLRLAELLGDPPPGAPTEAFPAGR